MIEMQVRSVWGIEPFSADAKKQKVHAGAAGVV